MSAWIRETMSIEIGLNLSIAYYRLDDGLSCCFINRNHLIQVRQINKDATISERGCAPIVSATAHAYFQFVCASELYCRYHVLFIGDGGDYLRFSGRLEFVPQAAKRHLIEVRLGWRQDGTLKFKFACQ